MASYNSRGARCFVPALLGVFVCFQFTSCDPIAGPYTIQPDHFEVCPQNMMTRPWTPTVRLVRARSDPHLWFIFANCTLDFYVDDFKHARLIFSSWSSRGGWKDNAVIMNFKRLCTTVKSYIPGHWNNAVKAVHGRGTREDCPFDPGYYYFHNFSMSGLLKTPIPVFFYGKWRVAAMIVDPKPQAVLTCVRVYANIIPKIAPHPG